MNVDGGGLYFESDLDNEKINAAIGETLRRIQGLSDGTVAAGKEMDDAFQKTADDIEKAFQDIDKMTDIHQSSLRDLEAEYARLGEAAANAFMSGKDDEYRALTEKQHAIKGEIAVRKELLKEIGEQADALAEAERKMEAEKKKVEENANAHVSMRTRIKELKEEMMLLIDQGIDEQSEAYKRLAAELGRLQDIQGDVAQQGRMLANDEQQFQGIITGLSGMAGGFSAVTGAVSLFAGENENLQKIMVKVQSLMAITIGLQQVAQTLNKDSAFQLVTLNGLKEWWNGLTAQAAATETAETSATVANTAAHAANTSAIAGNTVAETANIVATGGQAAAATAGTVANIGLAGAFRMVGLAIKSIPVFGWILAGISGLIALYSYFSGKAKEAAKAQEEFNNKLVESCFKPISSIESLSQAWDDLGDNLDAKKKFVEDYQAKFKELGVSVKDVADAENLLEKNKQAFIDSLMAKAKAAAAAELAQEKYKEAIKKQLELEKQPKTVTRYYSNGMYGGGGSYEIENPKIKKLQKQHDEYITEANKYFEIERQNTQQSYSLLQNAEIKAVDEYAAGTVGAIEQAIAKKREALKLIANAAEYKDALKVIENLEKDLQKITGKKTTGGGSSSKDPFLEKLDKQKKEYQRFMKWVNSGDEALVKAANKEFENLLKQGSTCIDYLKKQREIIESVDVSKRTKAQNAQLRTLNDQIAEETKKTVLEAFNTELSEQLNNAKSVMQMLNIIEQKRKELKNDGTELDNNKKETLDDAEKDVVKQEKEEIKAIMEEYSSMLDQRMQLHNKYLRDIALLEKQKSQTATESEKQQIDRTIEYRKKKYDEDKANLMKSGLDATKKLIDISKNTAILNISQKVFMWESDRNKAILEEQKRANLNIIEELKLVQKDAPTDEIANEIADITHEVELLNQELERIPKEKFQEMLSGLEKITSALGGLDGELGEVFSSIGSQIDNIKVSFDDTASTTDKISAGISAIVDIINMISSASAERKRVEREFYQNQIALAHEYALALNEQLRLQEELSGGGFVNDYAGKIESGFSALTDATRGYQEALSKLSEGKARIDLRNAVDWGNVGKGAATGAAAGAAIGSVVPVIGTAIGAVAGAIIGGLAGLFGGKKKKDQYGGLLDVFPELVDSAGNLNRELAQTLLSTKQVDDNTRQLIQNALDWADAMDAAHAQVKEIVVELAGDLGTNLKNSIVEAWKAGEDASKNMFDAASKSLEKFIEDLLYSTIFSEVFDEFATRLADSLSPSGDGDILDDYDWLMNEMNARDDYFIGLLEQVKNRAKARGFNAWEMEQEKIDASLTGSVKGVSEATASLVAGQMNAIRINQMEATAIIRQQLFHLANIDRNTGAIDTNTRFNRYIKDIYDKISTGDSLRSQGLS